MDTAQIKAHAGILEHAVRYTALKHWSSAELAGPCPRCGGVDRFHVHRDGWWKCYRCHPKPADVIELVQFAERCDFKTACARLEAAGGTVAGDVRQEREVRTVAGNSQGSPRSAGSMGWRDDGWQRGARQEIALAAQALAGQTELGDAARAYLAGRGLAAATLQAWSIGCARHMHPMLHTQAYCIVIPWQHSPSQGAGGTVKAVQYRYFGPVIGKRERFSARPGSERTVFGVDLLKGAGTLVLVEGELNALSIWQVAAATGLDLDVCSVGAEANVCHPAALKLADRYRQVVVWTDEPARARQALREIPHAVALTSPPCDLPPGSGPVGDCADSASSTSSASSAGGLDANDLLCAASYGPAGLLADFLPAALEALLPGSAWPQRP